MENKEIQSLARNNLDKSASPYLLQHTSNPVWWQEWSDDLIRHAIENDIPVLVSIGYSTCHWCHVMADGAFSDEETAQWLNNHFICIKVDREQRPDIDQYMMDFISRQDGRGGWPLNVFLTPELNPVYALTYAPAKSDGSMYSFLSIAEQVYDYIRTNREQIVPFPSAEKEPSVIGENSLTRILSDYYDPENGGFGDGHKFPPHSTMLYLLYQLGIYDSPSIKTIITKTLDSMMMRGLHDHLQGGIFRYCVNTEWTIPHFEKMLYDQAMALWVYSLAYRSTGREDYKRMGEKIIQCLNDSFDMEGLFVSGHDADTEHTEGSVYLWSYDELNELLSADEFSRFSSVYHISEHGNFENLNHLIRKNNSRIDDIEKKLLNARRRRIQPSVDEKILCGTNSLIAISLIQASRYLENPLLLGKAENLVNKIKSTFWDGRTLSHSLFNGFLQRQAFLSDAAAFLSAITLLYEQDEQWESLMDELAMYVQSFREDDKWVESKVTDFPTVYASWFDHPVPSSVSLAEWGITRYSYLTNRHVEPSEFREPFMADFYNIASMLKSGFFHVYTTNEFIPWDLIPINSLQLRGTHEQDCYMGVCRPVEMTVKSR